MVLDTYRGVDVANKIEAVTACNSCRWMHDFEPAPERGEKDTDGEWGG